MQRQDYNYLFKYIIVGNTCVGKTCFLARTTGFYKDFNIIHDITIGVDFGSEIFNINNKKIKIQFWDTAGQESYRSMIRSYYRNCTGVLLMYDITCRNSFDNIQSWLNEIYNYTSYDNITNKVPIILIGNKVDLVHKRDVTFEEGCELAKKNDILFIETSVKNLYNVNEAIQQLSQCILDKIDNNEFELDNNKFGIKVGNYIERKDLNIELPPKSGCC